LRRLALTGGLVGALMAYRQRRIARFERQWGYGPPRR
jgi:hypothetical protein